MDGLFDCGAGTYPRGDLISSYHTLQKLLTSNALFFGAAIKSTGPLSEEAALDSEEEIP